jgi:hypothetical protein
MAKKIKIELDFDHGQKVYLVTDPEQLERVVGDIRLVPGGVAIYYLKCGTEESEHYEFEISDTKKVIE